MIEIMDIFDAIVLGVIEGVTEFLPISSTGHLILFGKILNISDVEFLKSFNIAIQLGAILSVVYLFPRRFFSEKETFKKIFWAFLPTVLIGFVFYPIVKSYFLDNTLIVLISLFVGGVLFIVLERFLAKKEFKKNDISQISKKQAILIGFFQSIAMIPGVSRSASTIFGGMLLGISRTTIVEFSFLLAVPTMLSATALDLYKSYDIFAFSQIGILTVGFLASFFVSIFAIKLLLRYIKNNNFIAFGVYRILISLIFFLIFF